MIEKENLKQEPDWTVPDYIVVFRTKRATTSWDWERPYYHTHEFFQNKQDARKEIALLQQLAGNTDKEYFLFESVWKQGEPA